VCRALVYSQIYFCPQNPMNPNMQAYQQQQQQQHGNMNTNPNMNMMQAGGQQPGMQGMNPQQMMQTGGMGFVGNVMTPQQQQQQQQWGQPQQQGYNNQMQPQQQHQFFNQQTMNQPSKFAERVGHQLKIHAKIQADDSISSEPAKVAFSHPLSGIG
jgi:hypothetical protein